MKITKKAVGTLLVLLIANYVFFLTVWLLNQYDHVYFDQFLYALKSSSAGAQRSLTLSCVSCVGGFGTLLTLIEVLLYLLFSGKFTKKFERVALYHDYCNSKACRVITKSAFPCALAGLIFSSSLFVFSLDVYTYVDTVTTRSDFIEDNYADPNTVKLTFPAKKRNLIYIFLESMENAYADGNSHERFKINHIPELTKLAEENVNFSHTSSLGGALPFSGTTWTAAAMVSQTSGLTVKVPVGSESFDGEFGYMPGVVSIGEILEDNGYEQVLLVGSNAEFGSRESYFTLHGNYNILDTVSLKEANRLPFDYDEWWGFEDRKLFEFAKEELTRLSTSDKPFNLTLLTCDTHFPNGYCCELCEDYFDEPYSNVLRCSSKQVADFVEWIKAQPFYDNTTIVICGDHLTMDPEYMKDVNEDFTRTTYNCIINSAVSPLHEKNRLFGNFDMFPTTLAAIGVEIEGDRLGLGTNLFSIRKTLAEEYDFETLDTELQKKSDFYNYKILKGEWPIPDDAE